MAYKEVVVTDEAGGTFFKFNAIGDKLIGLYVSKKERPAHGEFKASTEYTFKNKSGMITLTPPAALQKRLTAAEASDDPLMKLIPMKSVCLMEFTSTKDIGQPQPMKIVSLKIDNERAAAKQPPPPPPPAEDDIPF